MTDEPRQREPEEPAAEDERETGAEGRGDLTVDDADAEAVKGGVVGPCGRERS